MESEGSLPGAITAYSAKTGDMAWRFNTIPRPGEPASETWEDPTSWEITGGANNWTGMALDKERELLFVPTGSATPDFYGATRPGDNLYANCLLALEARTGKLRRHYQFVRHDM